MAKRAPVVGGCLYVVATPIGNLEDISYRAVRVLREVDVVAAEDTRTARRLLDHFDIHTPTLSYFEGNEARRTDELVARLVGGESVALISEAGTPLVSDPGAHLVGRCVADGVPVDAIPGPSAVIDALVLSGLPAEPFRWSGFVPRKGAARRAALAAIVATEETTVLFEAPPRVGRFLAELAALAADRPAALVREMTKLHQQVVRGTVAELAERFAEAPPRGEVTIVIGGAVRAEALSDDALEAAIRDRLARGEGPRDVARGLAAAAGGRRRVYQLALSLFQDGNKRR